MKRTALSLFTSGGLGDLAVRQAGFEILVSNEKLAERHALFAFNFPSTCAITGDIWEQTERIASETRHRLGGRDLDLLYATPPCQGMSKNGRGKLLSAVRAGRKPALDERNRLIVPTMQLARRLRPEMVLLENVPEMADTMILDERGHPTPILGYIERTLGSEYVGRAGVVEFADYGVPQRRQRLITVYSRNPRIADWLGRCGTLMPTPTHTVDGRDGTARWKTVRDAIEGLPALDAGSTESAKSELPFHRVPLLDETKYWWVANTAPERSAFDNQCCACGFAGNRTHSSARDGAGINRASRTTPLHCERCGELLPRPSVERNGKRQLMRGYTSAYKRMAYDKPASALTRNLSAVRGVPHPHAGSVRLRLAEGRWQKGERQDDPRGDRREHPAGGAASHRRSSDRDSPRPEVANRRAWYSVQPSCLTPVAMWPHDWRTDSPPVWILVTLND